MAQEQVDDHACLCVGWLQADRDWDVWEMEQRRRWLWLWEGIHEDELQQIEKRRLAWGLDEPKLDVATLFSRQLCESCKKIPISQLLRPSGRHYTPSDHDSQSSGGAESCELCPIMLQSLGLENSRNVDEGFTILPKAGSELHFLLLNEWLRRCNGTHRHPISISTTLPTRVVDVGLRENPSGLHLYVTSGRKGAYVALSHRWSGDDTMFRTMNSNVQSRCERIEFNDLPGTFQDAVIVTRMLGVQYLWIDSLCVIQDDHEDKTHECSGMEKVFASAYCTIAATSATSCEEGFLRQPNEQRVRLQHKSKDTSLYVRKRDENFSRDVERGGLNQRGWVFQERALSRRTIHFTATQTYWECESVVSCETADEIDDKIDGEPNLLRSSRFPASISSSFQADQPFAFEDTFAKYSKLDLTYRKDRPSAIAGLVIRLEMFYNTTIVYGILKRFFGKSLLWYRAGDEWMERINDFENGRVPSWSWMAYKGEIGYNDIPANGLDWKGDVRFTFCRFGSQAERWCALEAPLAQMSRDCHIIRNKGINYEIVDETDSWIKYDEEHGEGGKFGVERLGCIVIAQVAASPSEMYADVSRDMEQLRGDFCYILLVTPIVGGDVKEAYRRVGVGFVKVGHVSYSEAKVWVI